MPRGIKPDTSGGFTPRYSAPRNHRVLSDDITRRDGRLHEVGVHADFAMAIRRRAVMLNTHASTTFEGNPLGLDEMSAVREGGTRPRRPEEREVRNHLDYYRALFRSAKKYSPLTADEILSAHRQLMEGVLPAGVGAWKVRQNVITDGHGKEIFYPTPPKRTVAEIEQLLAWYEGSPLPVPMKVAIWTHEFLSIHPFADGNGRVARALTHRQLYVEGYWGAQYVALDATLLGDRHGYLASLQLVQDQAWDHSGWVDHFLRRLSQAYEEAERGIRGMQRSAAALPGLRGEIMRWMIARGGSQFQRAEFLAGPVGSLYNPVSVSQALGALAAHGFLQPIGAGRGRAYAPGPRFAEFVDDP